MFRIHSRHSSMLNDVGACSKTSNLLSVYIPACSYILWEVYNIFSASILFRIRWMKFDLNGKNAYVFFTVIYCFSIYYLKI